MPTFLRPNALTGNDIYPASAGNYIEQLRRFIGHDRLQQKTSEYNKVRQSSGGVLIARMRERQPLLEAFEAYERATHHRRRGLNRLDDELSDLAHVATHFYIISSTLTDALARHQREKLVDLNGQLHPLLLEWKTASHFARTANAEIAWLDVNHRGPEFIARVGNVEWEVECKRQSHMIVELLGISEADSLADRIIQRGLSQKLRGDLVLDVPADFNPRDLLPSEELDEAMSAIRAPGTIHLTLPGGLQLNGELRPFDGHAIAAKVWQRDLICGRLPESRLYSHAKADQGFAVDPITLQMTSPRRGGTELVEYLWERKFRHAASQCSGQRGAVLSFEWENIDDPSIFRESEGIQGLMARTFDEYRHVAAISMRCDSSPRQNGGAVDYSVGAYIAKSNVTNFPEVLDFVHINR